MKALFKTAAAIGTGLVIGLAISMLISTQLGALNY